MRSHFFDGRTLPRQKMSHASSDPEGKMLGGSGTALMVAAGSGQMEVVNMLLEAGADVALKSSCVLQFLSRQLEKNLDPIQPHTSPTSYPAHKSLVSHPSLNLLAPFLEICRKGRTAAQIASEAGHEDIAKLLQEREASLPPISACSSHPNAARNVVCAVCASLLLTCAR
jgi:ankyrin repeat protein